MSLTATTKQESIHAALQHNVDELYHCITGNAALNLLLEQRFQQQWDSLYETCSWATVFQGRAFVTAWMTVFGHKYSPIIVFSRKGESLTGLLILALKHNDTKIVVAGHGEADSQSWLSASDSANSFISKALSMVLKQFPNKNIMFWNLAPDTPLEWAKQDPYWNQKCVLQTLKRPIIRMSQHTPSKRERKRMKQLQAIGSFEVITDRKHFLELLDELTIRHDFRHGAMFNRMPFTKEPCNKQLLLALFDAGLLHLAVFLADGEIVAAVAATVGKNRAHLGAIIFHSPKHAHLSPGIVHFLLTIDHFKSIGLEYFDLTPGGDAYKERLSTEHDTVHLLKVAHNSLNYHRKQLKNYVDNKLLSFGYRPIAVELLFRKKLYLLKEHGLNILSWYMLKRNASAQQTPPIRLSVTVTESNIHTSKPNINSYRDLLAYKADKGCLSKWEFLEDAMHRFESGQQVYTWSNAGRLRCCIWAKPMPLADVDDTSLHDLDKKAYLLSGLYCHAQSLPFLREFVQAIYLHLAQNGSTVELHLATDIGSKPIYQSILAVHTTTLN